MVTDNDYWYLYENIFMGTVTFFYEYILISNVTKNTFFIRH